MFPGSGHDVCHDTQKSEGPQQHELTVQILHRNIHIKRMSE